MAGLWGGGEVIAVLKGRQTIVGRSSGEVYLNATGNPGLAQGGTGDVLAGFLGGWLAQPGAPADALRAVRYGVWRHGEVADALERRGGAWTSDDLAALLG